MKLHGARLVVAAAVGLLVAVETAVAWAQPGWSPLVVPWDDWRGRLLGLGWDSGPVRLIAGVLVAVGVVLLLVALDLAREDRDGLRERA